MSLAHVSAAVSTRLEDGWTKCIVLEPNALKRKRPTGDVPFIDVQFHASNSAQITFGSPGSNVYRDEGAILLILNAVRDAGVDQPLAWLDELAALFRGKTFDGVRTYAPSPPVIDDRNDDGRYFLLSIAVPFEHDFLG